MSSELAAAGPRWLRVPKQPQSSPQPGCAREGDPGQQPWGRKGRARTCCSSLGTGQGQNRARCLLRMAPVSPSPFRCFSPSSQPSCHTLHAKYCQYCLERAPTAPKCFFTASYLTGVPSGPGPCSSAQGGRGGGVVPGLPEPPRSSSSTRTQPPSPRRAGSRGWPMAAMEPGRSGPEGCAGPAGRAELTSWAALGSGPGPTEPNQGKRLRPAPGPAPRNRTPSGGRGLGRPWLGGEGAGDTPVEADPGHRLPSARGRQIMCFY